MGLPARQISAMEALRALPEHQVGEILQGELHVQPRPSPRHGRAQTVLAGWLGARFDWGDGGPGGWWLAVEPELHLGGDVLVPDVAGWRRERLGALPEEPFFATAPDWVCEVLSPSTARTDRALKMPIYAREGVGHLWLLDPALHTLEAYQLERGTAEPRWVLLRTAQEDEEVALPPFEQVPLPLGALWGSGP